MATRIGQPCKTPLTRNAQKIPRRGCRDSGQRKINKPVQPRAHVAIPTPAPKLRQAPRGDGCTMKRVHGPTRCQEAKTREVEDELGARIKKQPRPRPVAPIEGVMPAKWRERSRTSSAMPARIRSKIIWPATRSDQVAGTRAARIEAGTDKIRSNRSRSGIPFSDGKRDGYREHQTHVRHKCSQSSRKWNAGRIPSQNKGAGDKKRRGYPLASAASCCENSRRKQCQLGAIKEHTLLQSLYYPKNGEPQLQAVVGAGSRRVDRFFPGNNSRCNLLPDEAKFRICTKSRTDMAKSHQPLVPTSRIRGRQIKKTT